MNWKVCVCMAAFLMAPACVPGTWGADVPATALETIRNVGPGSAGSADARQALQTLKTVEPAPLVPVLSAFRDASPLAINWLRNAFDTLASQQIADGKSLPAFELVSFVKDVNQSPVARRLAYEWMLKQDSSLEQKLIPGMLLDPSPEFRRDAVALWMQKARDETDPQVAADYYQQALRGVVHEDQVRDIDKALEATGQKVDIQRHFGFLNSWQVIGPFDNKEERGFAAVYPPESELDLTAEYQGQLSTVSWKPLQTEDDFGVLDIAKQIENYKGSVMYAATTYHSAEDRSAEIRLGTPNAWKLWVNGSLAFEREEYHRSSQMDQYKVPVQLKKGANSIVIKICQNEQTQDWAQRYQFQLRVCDSTGVGIPQAVQAAQRSASITGVR